MKPRILVCGGAGYIGSHMVRQLVQHGYDVVVFDNLSQGNPKSIADVPLVIGDLLDRATLGDLFAQNKFDAVYHFAGLSSVAESVVSPDMYYRNNVVGTLNLLDAMRSAEAKRLVFSSTAAIFGNPQDETISEGHPKNPLNSYGRSKLMVEGILSDYYEAYGLCSVSFRYFNAAGASDTGEIGEAHEPETHLIPNILLAALGKREALQIFGTDYDTRDGTCVRDYVHVDDIASAHLAALDYLDRKPGAHVFNLGNGYGFTIKEVIKAARAVVGSASRIPVQYGPRRTGDAAALVADSRMAREELGWQPRMTDIETIIASAWNWHRKPGFERVRVARRLSELPAEPRRVGSREEPEYQSASD